MTDQSPVIARLLRSPGSVVLLTCVLQFLLVSYTFPVSELFSEKELLRFDNGFHLYQILFATDLAKSFNVVGFDPLFAAGYLGGVTLNGSAKVPALMAIILQHEFSPIQTQKLFVFLSAVTGPACVPLAGHWLKAERREIFFATAFGFLLWWASAFRWYHTEGMVSFVLASYLSLPYFALVARSLQPDQSPWLPVMVGIIGAMGFLLHPLFPIPVGILTALYVLFAHRSLDVGIAIIRLVVIAVISLGLNLFWLIPSIRFPGYADNTIEPEMNVVDARLIVSDLLGVWGSASMGAKLYPVLALCTLWAFCQTKDAEQRPPIVVFVLAWLVVELFAVLGAAIPDAEILQPNRFSATAFLLLVFPAARGMSHLLDAIKNSRKVFRRLAKVTLLAVGAGTLFVTHELQREVSYAPVGHYGAIPPEVRGLERNGREILEWMNTATSRDGRILFENSNTRIYDQSVIAGYLALRANREMIGGPAPRMFFAGFWDGWVFGQPIGDIPPDRFREYLRRYNVGWIVAHSNETRRYLSNLPGIAYFGSIGPAHLYTFEQSLEYVLAGSAKVIRSEDRRLIVHFDRPEGGEAVLKYHYVPTLRVGSGAELSPVRIGDDPHPFIRVRSMKEEVEIRE